MTAYRRNGDWLGAALGVEWVMMSIESGNYLTLSRVGSRVWDLMESPKTIDELCALLVREFSVAPDACRHDVTRFIEEMIGHGAIVPVESSGAGVSA